MATTKKTPLPQFDFRLLSDQIKAVQYNPVFIQYIDYPAEEVQLALLKRNPWCFKHIANPTARVCVAAVKADVRNICFITSADPEIREVLLKGLKKRYLCDNLEDSLFPSFSIDSIIKRFSFSEEEVLSILAQNPEFICQMKEPTLAMQLNAVKKNPYIFRYIKHPHNETILYALSRNGLLIDCVKNPNETHQLMAVSNTADAIRFIKKPTVRVQLKAVKKAASMVAYIAKPALEVQIYIAKKAPSLLAMVNGLDEEILEEFVNLYKW